MFYLIYVSSATKLMNDEELLFLLNQSRDNNLKLNITGMLLYKSGNFMQMLEGEKQTVLELFETIKKDERHKDVYTILTGDIEKRNFEDWSMGFCNMDKTGGEAQYNVYIKQNLLLRKFHKDSRKAYRFMVSFNNKNR